MQIIIHELLEVVRQYNHKILAIPDAEFSAKPVPRKWSKIEVLGHLIDSAQNNLRRFICGQYEEPPGLITYDQDLWVTANQYRHASKDEMIQLWTLLNQRIASVLQAMPPNIYGKLCPTATGGSQTLDWFAADYVKHLKHHLNQILPGSFNISYP
jgi:DinB superfamily